MEPLNREETLRYSRHFNLKEVGLEGQQRLKGSSVLLIGAGGLGSPLALYLVAAGVGHIGMVDFDIVDETNLQRQVMHGSAMVGKSKLESARLRLTDLNPHVRLSLHETRLESSNALQLFADYDVIADGADNFATRYLVNDACVLAGKPLVSASILGFEGQLSVFNYQAGPCYRCLFPEPPPAGAVPSCAEGGVLGVLPGVMGCLQATEVIKVLLNVGDIASGRLVLYDALALRFTELKISPDKQCAICSENAPIRELIDYASFCGDNHTDDTEVSVLSCEQVHERLDQITLIDVRKPFERQICAIEGAHALLLDDIGSAPLPWPLETPLVTYCKTGVRSRRAAIKLMALGFTNVSNMAGGIMAWADRIDTRLFKY